MFSPSGCSRDNIGTIVGVKATDTLQVAHCVGSSANYIIMKKVGGG